MSTLSHWIPSLDWLRNYRREDLGGDLSAGLTVAVMLIPQGMAYAMLAGLPPIIGLYASILPLLVYALLGTSRQLAVGPVAMVSLLVASGVGQLAPVGSASFVSLAVMLALMVGVLQLLMGIARMGFLVQFLSHPVISGFTSAAALIIGLSQLKHVLGVPLPRSHHVHELLWSALQRASQIHPTTLALGLGGVMGLVLLKRWKPAFPGALVVVAASALVVWGLRLDRAGVAIVGKVPSGFPPFALPTSDWQAIKSLLPTALAISLVGFMESIAVAKGFAAKHRYSVDANQELVALGAANIVGSLSLSYPVTGGFSRTAVNAQAGARTGLASILTAGIIALSLLFFTPIFTFIPKATLAAIILVAVAGLFDAKALVQLWKVKRVDAAMLLLTFLVTLAVGIEIGIGVGVVASLAAIIHRSSQPHTAELGYLAAEDVFRNLRHYPHAQRRDDVAILRIDAALYFANSDFLKQQLLGLIPRKERGLRAIILDASGINDLDSSAAHALEEAHRDLHELGIQLYIASAKGPVREVLESSGLKQRMGGHCFAMSIQSCLAHIDGLGEA